VPTALVHQVVGVALQVALVVAFLELARRLLELVVAFLELVPCLVLELASLEGLWEKVEEGRQRGVEVVGHQQCKAHHLGSEASANHT